jgi:hypothetical protein
MYGALETVEIVGLAAHDDLEGFVVVITATFANGHLALPSFSASRFSTVPAQTNAPGAEMIQPRHRLGI